MKSQKLRQLAANITDQDIAFFDERNRPQTAQWLWDVRDASDRNSLNLEFDTLYEEMPGAALSTSVAPDRVNTLTQRMIAIHQRRYC